MRAWEKWSQIASQWQYLKCYMFIHFKAISNIDLDLDFLIDFNSQTHVFLLKLTNTPVWPFSISTIHGMEHVRKLFKFTAFPVINWNPLRALLIKTNWRYLKWRSLSLSLSSLNCGSKPMCSIKNKCIHTTHIHVQTKKKFAYLMNLIKSNNQLDHRGWASKSLLMLKYCQ